MSSNLLQGFRLGPWWIEPLLGAVTGSNDEVLHLEPKVMDVFLCLAEHANELVTRNQLLDAVWHGQDVTDEPLTRAISELRRALHDDRGDPQYIETIPKRGYRLIGDIYLLDGTRLKKKQAHSVFITRLNQHKPALVVVTVLILVAVYLAYDEFVVDSAQKGAPATTITQTEGTSDANQWEKSVAVLPFVNMSGDPDNEYFSDGLSEEIMNLLANIPGLKVIGRTSSFSFKGKNEDIRVIGRTLGVKTVLEGSVRRSGDRVRVTAQLVDVSDGTHIWSETYERTMTDIFEIQDNVAAAIIDAMQIHVGPVPRRGRPTENTEAYALFLKARDSHHELNNQNPNEMLLQAIELDPNFAEAYELLALIYFRTGGYNIKAVEGQKLVGEAAAKALAIDPHLVFAQALYQAGNIENWSFAREIEAFERAARKQADNPELLIALSFDLLIAGYLQEALSIAERLVDLDPLSIDANRRLSQTLYAAGRTSEAISSLELQVQLGNNGARWDLGRVNLIAKRDDIAIEYFEAYGQQIDYPDQTWVREFVPRARDPALGKAYVDREIEESIASVPEEDAYRALLIEMWWYLGFGYLDRYFELILARDLTASTWTDAESMIVFGTQYRRLGFTAHPKYLEVAEATGIMDVWEQRGPPDFCEKMDGEWVCE